MFSYQPFLRNMELKFFFFVPVNKTFGIDWDTHWYTFGHCIYLRDVETDLARLALTLTWSSGLALLVLVLADLSLIISTLPPTCTGPEELMGS